MPVDPLREHAAEQLDIPLEADAAADFQQIVAGNAAKIGIVREQIGQLGTLLNEIELRQRGDALPETRDPQHLAQDVARVVEAQCLIEIACQQVMPLHPISLR